MFNNNQQSSPLDQQLDRTIKAIEEYRSRKYSNCFETHTLESLLFCMLQRCEFQDKINDYEQHIVVLLMLFTHKEVTDILNQHLDEKTGRELFEMLFLLYEFFRCLDGEYYRSLIELTAVQDYHADGNQRKLEHLEQLYRAKLQGYEVEVAAMKVNLF